MFNLVVSLAAKAYHYTSKNVFVQLCRFHYISKNELVQLGVQLCHFYYISKNEFVQLCHFWGFHYISRNEFVQLYCFDCNASPFCMQGRTKSGKNADFDWCKTTQNWKKWMYCSIRKLEVLAVTLYEKCFHMGFNIVKESTPFLLAP